MIKKKIAVVLAIAAIVLVTPMFAINGQSSSGKKSCEFEEYSSIADGKISEICLRKAIDSANWAVFSDEDLI